MLAQGCDRLLVDNLCDRFDQIWWQDGAPRGGYIGGARWGIFNLRAARGRLCIRATRGILRLRTARGNLSIAGWCRLYHKVKWWGWYDGATWDILWAYALDGQIGPGEENVCRLLVYTSTYTLWTFKAGLQRYKPGNIRIEWDVANLMHMIATRTYWKKWRIFGFISRKSSFQTINRISKSEGMVFHFFQSVHNFRSLMPRT